MALKWGGELQMLGGGSHLSRRDGTCLRREEEGERNTKRGGKCPMAESG